MKTLLFLSLVFCSQAFAQDNCLSSIESTLIKADVVTERFEESIDYISANLVLDFENREIGRVYGDCSQVYRNYPNELKNYCSKMNAKLQAREVLIRKNLAAKKSRLYSILSLNEQNREEAAYACPDLN